jgi:hypothetical protein
MNEITRSVANGYESPTAYNFPDYEWRWWFNVLAVAIVLAITILIS